MHEQKAIYQKTNAAEVSQAGNLDPLIPKSSQHRPFGQNILRYFFLLFKITAGFLW